MLTRMMSKETIRDEKESHEDRYFLAFFCDKSHSLGFQVGYA